MSDLHHNFSIVRLHHKKVVKFSDTWQIGVLLSKTFMPLEHPVSLLNVRRCTTITQCFEVSDGEHIRCLVGTPYRGKPLNWCKLCVPCNHKANMHVINLATADHLHCPGEQVPIPLSAGSVVKKDCELMGIAVRAVVCQQ